MIPGTFSSPSPSPKFPRCHREQGEDFEAPEEHAKCQHDLHDSRKVTKIIVGADLTEAWTNIADRSECRRSRRQEIIVIRSNNGCGRDDNKKVCSEK